MRNSLSDLEIILSRARTEKLRQNGAIVFDVDDTLLARRTKPTGCDQVFSESPAAVSLPLLLNAGIKVCIITGHGWKQLENRLVKPLADYVLINFAEKSAEMLKNFYIYANRGATKIVWQNGIFIKDESYGHKFILENEDVVKLREIFNKLINYFKKDFIKHEDFYRLTFSKFNFDESVPQIIERENVVLGLRPVPSETHCETHFSWKSPRHKLYILGGKKIREANLDKKYEIGKSGKSTLEIIRNSVSKKIAFQDLKSRIAKEKQVSTDTVESSIIYIGDEFTPDGNDYVISQNFTYCLCFSVAPAKCNEFSKNIFFLRDFFQLEGISATSFLIAYILNVLT